MSRPNAKASTSPSTPSAPTTCKCSPGARFLEHDPEKWTSGFPKGSCFYKGPRPQLRFGHIPGNALTVEGLQRKLGPLSLWSVGRDQFHRRKIMTVAADVASND